jgi:hypothetical protein
MITLQAAQLGEIFSNGPVILAEAPEGRRLLWNELAWDSTKAVEYNHLSTGIKDLVKGLAGRKILMIKALRALARGFGYDMSLWEAKVTCDAVQQLVIFEARLDLRRALLCSNVAGIEKNAGLLRAFGEPIP